MIITYTDEFRQKLKNRRCNIFTRSPDLFLYFAITRNLLQEALGLAKRMAIFTFTVPESRFCEIVIFQKIVGSDDIPYMQCMGQK